MIASVLSTLILIGALMPSSRAFLKNGDILHQKFQNPDALTQYQKAFEAQPDEYEVLYKLMRAHNDVGEELNDRKDKEAASHFQKALEIAETLEKRFPNKAEVHFYLAVLNGNLGNFGSTSEKLKHGRLVYPHAKKAIELDASLEDAYVVLGAFYREIAGLSFVARMVFGRIPEATYENSEKLLRQALKLKPTELFATFELANTLKSEGKFEEAGEYYEKVLRLPRTDARQTYIQDQSKQFLKEIDKTKKRTTSSSPKR